MTCTEHLAVLEIADAQCTHTQRNTRRELYRHRKDKKRIFINIFI